MFVPSHEFHHGNTPILLFSSTNTAFRTDTIYLLALLAEQGYFFVILLTLVASFLSDKPNAMQGNKMYEILSLFTYSRTFLKNQVLFSLGGWMLCTYIGFLRIVATVALDNEGPPAELDVEHDEDVAIGLPYGQDEKVGKENNSNIIYDPTMEIIEVDNSGPTMKVRNFQPAIELSYGIGVLLILLAFLFLMDAFLRIRRDCYTVGCNLTFLIPFDV